MQSLLSSLDQERATKHKLVMKTHSPVSLKTGPNPFLVRLLTASETPGETSGCSSGRPALTKSGAESEMVPAWGKQTSSHRDQLLCSISPNRKGS